MGVALVMVGCGSSGSGTAAGGASGRGAGGRAVQSPVQARGIKGENPATEAAGTAHLSAADCERLAGLAERQTGTRLKRRSTPKPPLSRCRLSGPGASIDVYLDAGFAADQRFHNRIDETVQFNTENPAGLPRPVPHVGEKAAYDADAQWIPALGSLLAVRGNRWLTVTISDAGRSDRRLLAEAAVLARAGFKLSASG
ncbi:MAG TPA: hypothetical protein VMF55_12365 [Solirubrobacterales bacterium]|nr:hypothetical protein [Solirubrobacterales bacterium]